MRRLVEFNAPTTRSSSASPCMATTLPSAVSRSGTCIHKQRPAGFVSAAVPLVGAGPDGPLPGAGRTLQHAQLRFPDRSPAGCGSELGLLALLPGQRHRDGHERRGVSVSQRQWACPQSRLGAHKLHVLHGRRLQRRRRHISQWHVHPGPPQSLASVRDGASGTVAASEQPLGIPGPYTQTSPTPVPSPRIRAFARVWSRH